MPRVRYDGPGHVLLAFGQTVHRGETVEFGQSETWSLLDQPHLRITVDEDAPVDAPAPRLGKSSLEIDAHSPSDQRPRVKKPTPDKED